MNTVFEFIQDVFAEPFGFVLGGLYKLTDNYILAIFLMTLLIKLCLLPFSVRQYGNIKKQNQLKPQVRKINERFKGNKKKIDEEVKALYKKEKVGSSNSGCLTSIIQIIVFIGLFGVINTPLSSILGFSQNTVKELSQAVANIPNASEIQLLQNIEHYKDVVLNENIITEQTFSEVITLKNNFHFITLDLSLTPQLNRFDVYWIIPISVFMINILSSLYAHIIRKRKHPGKKGFTAIEAVPFITPMITGLFSFLLPTGIGLYWIISSLLSLIQTVALNKIFKTDR